jgi:sugar phosphate isomerase/epimerase
MITTGLISQSDPVARPILSTAGRLGIPFFKLGYWPYPESLPIESRIPDIRREVAGLVAMGKEHGVAAAFHNHSGNHVGAAVWDIRAVIDDMDPRWAGYYFDPCHATAEGGVGGWLIALRMALSRIKMVAIEDFYWEKRDGKWRMRMCPLGDGMVDWPKFFSLLAAARFAGPISLHLEYDAADEIAAIERDFEFLRRQVDSVYRGVS